jgi:hypothetical protein
MTYRNNIRMVDPSANPFDVPIKEQILSLQLAQLQHDEAFHKEIRLLPVNERIKHFALHFAKYLGYLAEAQESHDVLQLERALVDTFIITIASANTLDLDLSKAVSDLHCPNVENLMELGFQLARGIENRESDPFWFILRFARSTGRLAKACESLDHLEAFPFRETMTSSVLDIFKFVIVEAHSRQLDLVRLLRERLRDIEDKYLFRNATKPIIP